MFKNRQTGEFMYPIVDYFNYSVGRSGRVYLSHRKTGNTEQMQDYTEMPYYNYGGKKYVKLINSHTLEIKKSKFIAYYYEVDDASEVKDIINNLKKEHKKARHIPYAYKINQDMKKSDDKEPSGTSGMPILNIIQKNNLNHTLIAVVRYFGGIKLGAGGLIRAYSSSAKEVIKID